MAFPIHKAGRLFFFEGKNTVFILIFLTLFKNLFEISETFSLEVKDPFFFYPVLPFIGPMSIFSIFRRFLNPHKLLIFDS